MAANIQALLAQMRQGDRGGGLTRPHMPSVAPSQSGGLPQAVARGRLPMRKTGVASPQRQQPAPRPMPRQQAGPAPQMRMPPRQAQAMPPMGQPPMGQPPMGQPPMGQPPTPLMGGQPQDAAVSTAAQAGEMVGREDAQVDFLAKVIEAMMKAGTRSGRDVAEIFGMIGRRRVLGREAKKTKTKTKKKK